MGREPGSPGPRWTRHSGIGVEFAAAVAGLALLGYWIDAHYGTGPWGVLIGAALGLVGGMYNFIRRSLQAFKDQSPPRKGDKDQQP